MLKTLVCMKAFLKKWTQVIFLLSYKIFFLSPQLEVMSAGAGQCICELKVANEHQNRSGLLHGGMTSTLVDAVSTMALFSKIERFGVSIEMNVS